MKALLKKTALLCLFVIATVCIGLFAACGDDNDNNDDNLPEAITYTVLVQDDNNAPLKGVSLYFSKGTTRYDNVTTGDDGKASMELAPDTYSVSFIASTLPDGYNAPDDVQVTKDNASVTVTLVKDFRYVVNLVKEDNTPFYAENVMIAICKIGGNCLTPSPVGTDGKWSISNVDAGDYKVLITFPDAIKDKYTFEGNTATEHYYTGKHFSATETEMTIVIKEVKAVKNEYTVTVVDDSDQPVKNVYVNLVSKTASQTPVQTGDDGKAKIEVPAYGEYSVTVNAPDGYTFDNGAYKTTENNHEITVKIHTLNALEFETAMTDEEVTSYGEGFYQFSVNEQPAYSYISSFAANQAKYYSFTAHKTGEYVIYCKTAGAAFAVNSSSTIIDYTNGDTFEVESATAHAYSVTKGNTVYFSVTAKNAGNLQFVIAAPDKNPDSSSIEVTEAGTHEITVVSAAKYATIIFSPSQDGVYEISSEGAFDTKVEYFANASTMFKTGEDDDSGEGNNFKLGEIEFKEVGPTCAFRVYVKEGATFPAVFNVKIVRTGDAEKPVIRVPQNMVPEEIGTDKYAGTGTFNYVDLSSEQTIVKGEDGYYHLDDVNGAVLVVKLGVSFRNNFSSLPMVVDGGESLYIPDHNDATVAWNYLEFANAYAALTNDDGVYPVNDELKLMLERWATHFINEFTFGLASLGTIAEGNEWLIPCGYYIVNELEGDGSETSAYKLDLASYDVTLKSGDTFFMSAFGINPGDYTVTILTKGSVTVDTYGTATVEAVEGGYAFDCTIQPRGVLQFKVVNAGADVNATVIFAVKQSEAGENELVVGANTVSIPNDKIIDGVEFTFVAEKDTRYVISSTSEGAYIIAGEGTIPLSENPADGIEFIEGAFAVTFDAQAGQTYKVLLGYQSFEGGEYAVYISEELVVGANEIEADYDGRAFGFSVMSAGKYIVYAVTDDENCGILFHDAFNGYSGDSIFGNFAFVIDCEMFVNYYFDFCCEASRLGTTATYTVNIVKYADVSLLAGLNYVTGTVNGAVYAFTAEKTTTYKFVSSDSDAALLVGFDVVSEELGVQFIDVDYKLAVEEGKTYFIAFSLSMSCYDEEKEYEVAIAEVVTEEVEITVEADAPNPAFVIFQAEFDGNYVVSSADAKAVLVFTTEDDLTAQSKRGIVLNHVLADGWKGGEGSGFEHTFEAVSGEFYLIKLGSAGDFSCTYSISIEYVGGDVAPEVPSNEPLNFGGFTPVNNGNSYTFTAPAAGTYVISAPDETSFFQIEGETGFAYTYEVTLAENETVNLTSYFNGMIKVELKAE